jgi:ParB-like chromosome segregation protein Spo0J
MAMEPDDPTAKILRLPLLDLGESLSSLRIARPALEEKMRRSLEAHGQLTPVTAWVNDGKYELVDGFKRLHAARRIPGLTELAVRVAAEDAIVAKRAMLTLNQLGAGLTALEEAWVVRSLVREERLTQQKVATVLGRDRSWVSRRLSLAERLIEPAHDEMRLGLLSPTVARTLASVPRGTQENLLEALHRETLTSRQVATLVGLLATASPTATAQILANPRDALTKGLVGQTPEPPRDLSLGVIAAEVDRQTRLVLNLTCRLATTLDRMDFVTLKTTERSILEQGLQILWRQLIQLQRTMRSKLAPTSAAPDSTAEASAPPSSPAAPTSRTSSSTCTA